MTYEEMIECLRAGRVNVDRFDEGRKTLEELYDEIDGYDVTLTLVEMNGVMRAVRSAMNVKILIKSRLGYFCETSRTYRNGERVEKFSPWGLSETRKKPGSRGRRLFRGEFPIQTAVQGFWEEDNYRAPRRKIKLARGPEGQSIHDSSVFGWVPPGDTYSLPVVSQTQTHYGRFVQHSPYRRNTTIRDGSVKVSRRWLMPEELSEENRNEISKAERFSLYGARASFWNFAVPGVTEPFDMELP